MSKRESSVLKGIAILLMLAHHLFYDAVIYTTMDVRFFLLSQEQLIWLGSFGKICVALFVFVSSYGISKSLSARPNGIMRDCIVRRYVRLIFPFVLIYLMALAAALISGRLAAFYGTGVNVIYYAAVDALGLANLLGAPTLNGTWWYMSYALALILLVPLLNVFFNRFGTLATILLCVLLPAYMGLGETETFRWYMMTVALGVVTARTRWLDTLRRRGALVRTILLISALVCVFVCAHMRHYYGHYWILDAILSTLFVIMVPYIARIPVLGDLLAKLGKHSMNIFLTHSFIFYYYCREFIYGFHYPILIYLALLATSLVLSVLIELLKKVLRMSSLERAAMAGLGLQAGGSRN